MAFIHVKNFLGGLDSRRLAANTPGGALLQLDNAHISRGGEIEQRKGFIPIYSLPAGVTKSLAGPPNGLTVFGSAAQPQGLPLGVNYQQLVHPTHPTTALTSVLSSDLFSGQIYAAALFADGSINHYYNGGNVSSFFDGRASAQVQVVGGGVAASATGSFAITGGTPARTASVTPVISGGGVTGYTVVDGGSGYLTAPNLVLSGGGGTGASATPVITNGAITGFTSIVAGTGYTSAPSVSFTGGGYPGNQITAVKVGSTNLLSAAVNFNTTAAQTASDVAANINANTGTSGYTAAAVGAVLTITASTAGSAPNGQAVAVTATGNVTVGSVIAMAGGQDTGRISNITINGAPIINAPVVWATSNANAAALIAAAINTYISSPDYTAVANGNAIIISAVTAGTAANNYPVVFTTSGALTLSPASGLVLGGGANPPVAGGSGAVATPVLVGSPITAINVISGGTGYTSAPSVTITDAHGSGASATAVISGGVVTGVTLGAGGTGYVAPTISLSGGGGAGAAASTTVAGSALSRINVTNGGTNYVSPTLTISDPTGTGATASVAVTGGTISAITVTNAGSNYTSPTVQIAETNTAFQPGPFVKTLKTKVYTISGSNVIFSGVGAPTGFTLNNTGAGLINMATQTSGAENLAAVGVYQKFGAIFSDRSIQIWYFDADPTQNQQFQVLNNTGTTAPRSVVSFGDSDLFYLAKPGVRSIKPRDASNAAITSDIGTRIDTYLAGYLSTLTQVQRDAAIAVIEPTEGRFWLAVGSRIFVFSFFQSSEVSAWSTYTVSYNGVALSVDDMCVYQQQVWIRSGDTIYAYGGLTGQQYDPTAVVTARLPYLEAGKPSEKKRLTGMDASVQGIWKVSVGMDVNNLDATDLVGIINETTFEGGKMACSGRATHFSFLFESQPPVGVTQVAPAVLGSVVLHFEDGPPD